MSDGVKTEVQLQLSPTHQAIRELKNYHSFSFTHSLLSARDMYKHENRAIGVFTSGDDAPGSIQRKISPLLLLLTDHKSTQWDQLHTDVSLSGVCV